MSDGVLKRAFAFARTGTDEFVKGRLGLALMLVFATAVLAALAPIALKYAVDALGSGQPVKLSLGFLADWSFVAENSVTLGPVALISFYLISLWISRSRCAKLCWRPAIRLPARTRASNSLQSTGLVR